MASHARWATQQSYALRRELDLARAQTDSLFDLIGAGSLYARPIAERHRLVFYRGHFDAFDFNLIARRSMSAPGFHPDFDSLFERGIDPAPGEAPMDSPKDWPSRGEIDSYVAKTRRWIDTHFEDIDPWVLNMAIEHRHMHAETFAYLLHGLPHTDKKRPDNSPIPRLSTRSAPVNSMVPISAGRVTLGKSRDGFGWDNEHLGHDAFVQAFNVSRFKISNGEYLEFVRDGGPVPHFWLYQDNTWFFRGMFANIPLPLDWPAWVTMNQARNYAQWRGLDLLTEAQYHRALQVSSSDAQRDNYGYYRWYPIPVDAAASDSETPSQLVGNGWEWTQDVFAPFDGFAAHPFYPGYSADFFDGQHYVMKGASPRTAAVLTRPSFRNWFRPDYPYMYAGFRVVANGAA